ncbi:MAG: ABC transporter permease subunit [Oscillospiraceae bacterium]|jgi:peptide/nickel transport system permease protein|nr:ABC transporter permease subunit [Oscillospiraceae bacterium]
MGKKQKDLFREEMVQSPGRTAARNFFSRRLSIVGMAIFAFIFFGCLITSLVIPIDLTYTDSTRINLPPSLDYLRVPDALAGNIKAMDIGSTYGMGIDQNGKLHMWGTMYDTAAKLKDLPADMKPLKLIACGLDHASAVAEDGTIYSWGNDRMNITKINEDAQGKDIVDIQAGQWVTIALDSGGNLYFWGNDSQFTFRASDHQGSYKAFAINIATAIGLTNDGNVMALTRTDTGFSRVPDEVQGHAVAVASTDKIGAALLDDGRVITWGPTTEREQLTVPEEIQGRVTQIDGGRTHFSALLDDGSVVSWGENSFGQINYPSLTGYDKVIAGYYQNAALTSEGGVATWGQRGYLMGTDQSGRDVFTRLIYGGRISLTVGFISVLISGFIGILLGGMSGYFGGKTDMFIMRLGEVFSSIPFIPLAIMLAAVVSNRISDTQRVIMIMFILGFLNWPGFARLARAQILSEKQNEFVTAAQAMGIRERVIIFRHIMPNVLGVVLVSLTLSMATCLLLESTLSFLGFGIIEPTPTWGNMLNKCVDSTVIRKFWWRWVFPSLALGLSTISINIMGDGLRDAIDPKSNDR